MVVKPHLPPALSLYSILRPPKPVLQVQSLDCAEQHARVWYFRCDKIASLLNLK